MAINFDALPNSNPGGSVVPGGTYYATIEQPSMKTPQPKEDGTVGADYLNMKFSLQNSDMTFAGSVWDRLVDSNHELMRYKLRRFIEALEIPIQGDFELKDLVKIINGKKLIVDIKVETKNNKEQSVVDLFGGDIYYSVREAARIFGNSAGVTAPTAAPTPAAPVNTSAPEVPETSSEEY